MRRQLGDTNMVTGLIPHHLSHHPNLAQASSARHESNAALVMSSYPGDRPRLGVNRSSRTVKRLCGVLAFFMKIVEWFVAPSIIKRRRPATRRQPERPTGSRPRQVQCSPGAPQPCPVRAGRNQLRAARHHSNDFRAEPGEQTAIHRSGGPSQIHRNEHRTSTPRDPGRHLRAG
jgi:hypothetical protein